MFGFGNDNKVKDPVCGMKIDKETTKFAFSNGGKKFYFCSQNCKDVFTKDFFKESAKTDNKSCC